MLPLATLTSNLHLYESIMTTQSNVNRLEETSSARRSVQ